MRSSPAPLLLERGDFITDALEHFGTKLPVPMHFHGTPGVGKSALAQEILARWIEQGFTGLLLRWSLLDERGLLDAISHLSTSPREEVLIVLDDAHDFPLSLLETDALWRTRLLLVARRQLSFSFLKSVEVPPLSHEASRQLLRGYLGEERFVGADSRSIDTLISALDGIPRAIELAAGRARLMGVEPLSRYLHEDLGVLSQQLVDRSTRHRSVRLNMSQVWSGLDPRERALLQVCSIFEEKFTLDEITVASGLALPEVLRALDGLVAASAISTHLHTPARFEVLNVMRTFITQHADARVELLEEARGRVIAFVDQRAREIMQDLLDARAQDAYEIGAHHALQAATSALARAHREAEDVTTAARCLLATAWLEPDVGLWDKIIRQTDRLLADPSLLELPPQMRSLLTRYRAFLSWGTREYPHEQGELHGVGAMRGWAELLASWSHPGAMVDGSWSGLSAELNALLELERCRVAAASRMDNEEIILEITRIVRSWPRHAAPLLGSIFQGLQAECYINLGMAWRALPLVDDTSGYSASHPVLRVWWARLFARAAASRKQWSEIEQVLVDTRVTIDASTRAAMMLDLELARLELVQGHHAACVLVSERVLEHLVDSDDPLFLHAFTLLFLAEILAAYEIENTNPTWIHARLQALGYPVEFASWWERETTVHARTAQDAGHFEALRMIANSIYGHGLELDDATPTPIVAHHELWSDTPDPHAWKDMHRWRSTDDIVLTTVNRAIDVLLTHSRHRSLALVLFTPSNSQEAVFDMEHHRIKLGVGEWIDFSNRPKMRRLLEALLEAHERDALVSSEELIEFIWEGERIRYDSALSRLYNLLSTTRKLGLKPILVKEELGYGFSQDWSVRVIE